MRKVLFLSAWVVLGLIGPVVFLAVERGNGLDGFPLDDAWIHQTYARSLAEGQGWTYDGGDLPSAGSTSPLWTALQIPSFWLHISPMVWSGGLGVLLLLANAALIMLWIRGADPNASRYAFLFCAGEWHLVWAALSGMETILFCSWISLAVYLFFPLDSQVRWKDASSFGIFLFGLLAGMGLWIRPEAILLSGLILPAAILQWKPVSRQKAGWFILGIALPILAYFSFEFSLNGRFLPNTFFVKSAEYSVLTSASILLRLLQPWPALLAGLGAILILFLPAAAGSLLRERKILGVLPVFWALGHLIVYAVQLPATYQHGRYFLPILPVLIGYGVYGYSLLARKYAPVRPARILLRALGSSAAVLTAIFLWIGARQFSSDVGTIEEIVAVAKWIRGNTPADSVVAAHDIGALGFFGERKVVDLGGVTDLGALPLLNGTVSLRQFLSQKRVDYLMSMPVFYPADLASCVPLPESPHGLASENAGFRTLLYDWRSGCEW